MPDIPIHMSLETLRADAVLAHPEFADSQFTMLADGWDSVALDIDDRYIIKFPRHDMGAAGLRNEGRLLDLIGRSVDLPVPSPLAFELPRYHTMHRKLPGVALDPAVYATLAEPTRQAIGEQLGLFYAQLHAIDADLFRQGGAAPVQAWLDAEAIRLRIAALLPAPLEKWATKALAQWQQLPPDPHGTTFGFFDGHGWNMAYDAAAQRLGGVFDFGDSGFGPLHQEFVYSNLISPDLTRRIIDSYERHSGRIIDRDRVLLLTDIHRLWEIAEEYQNAESVALMIAAAENWLAIRP